MKNPSKIRNKIKRTEIYSKYKSEKKQQKKKLRQERLKEVEELGESAPPKQAPRTIENTRIHDETTVKPDDVEVFEEERSDEFSKYFSNEVKPKIMISTRPKCSRKLFPFIADLMQMIPNAFYYPRGTLLVEDLVKDASSKGFTHLMILAEKQKECNGLLICHLPVGPTAFFKLSSFEPGSKIPGHGKPTSHIPELILNNFGTRLGRRTGRFLGSLFPHEPEFEGRQVVTFHNQRDFVFVRHHRYVYRREKKKDSDSKGSSGGSSSSVSGGSVGVSSSSGEKIRARLQELGPRFTLKMKWLQDGAFDTQFGEYEWICKRKLAESSRKKFSL